MKNNLVILDGGRPDLEHKKRLLFNAPETFSSEEFESLCEQLKLGNDDIAFLISQRFRKKGGLERNAILSILDGNVDEANRLRQLIENRNTLKKPRKPRSNAGSIN